MSHVPCHSQDTCHTSTRASQSGHEKGQSSTTNHAKLLLFCWFHGLFLVLPRAQYWACVTRRGRSSFGLSSVLGIWPQGQLHRAIEPGVSCPPFSFSTMHWFQRHCAIFARAWWHGRRCATRFHVDTTRQWSSICGQRMCPPPSPRLATPMAILHGGRPKASPTQDSLRWPL